MTQGIRPGRLRTFRTRPTSTPLAVRVAGAGQALWLCFVEARPTVQSMFVLRLVVGGMLCDTVRFTADIVRCGIAWLLAIASSYIWNGCSDLVSDRINGSGRPLATGMLERAVAFRVAAATAAASLVLSALVSVGLLLHTIGALLLGYAYSFGRHALKRGAVGVTFTAVAIGVLSFDAGRVAFGGTITAEFVTFTAGLTLWLVIGGAVKDLDHLPGDIAAGRRPFFARVGYPRGSVGVACGAVVPSAGIAYVALVSGVPLKAAAVGSIVGSLALWVCPWRGFTANTPAGRRRPYRAFMHTQYAAHLGCLVELGLAA
ncbi:UbiA family prenyltransferase [Nocardia sp. CNY236]|uniref:UbiA family prenyltransferase n=1 Tax=Nocardia sp. CNY236 TaxID=1169152 RepID=UPI0009DF9345|nr:UbiA family prenyltransferase [Nocardia sp. CNY236]